MVGHHTSVKNETACAYRHLLGTMPKKGKAERWREMAERARARANGMRDAASERALLGIALGYETLARRADRLAAREQSAEKDEKPD